MTTQHGYLQYSGASIFAQAMLGGAGDGGEFAGDDTTGPLGIGSVNNFSALEAFLSFDTSAVSVTPVSATLTLGQSFGSVPVADVIVAVYNWGNTVETADWRGSAQLAALTEVGRIAAADLPGAGSTFDVAIDPAGITLGGTTHFVVFTENMATPTIDPVGNEQMFIDGAADTNPPALNTVAPPPSPPTVTSISPSFGTIAGGTSVTIRGTGFATVTGVFFGATSAASFAIVDANTITAIAPAHAAGIVDVTVVNPDGTSATGGASSFSYFALDAPPAAPDPVTIRSVTVDGTLHQNLPLAWCESITRTHNQPREAVIKFPKQSYTRDQAHIFAKDDGTGDLHEIQVIRNGIVRFWGPAVLAEAKSDDPTVTFHGRDPLWYLMRRFLDAQRTNLLTNPSFETGDATGWTSVGSLDTDEVTTADAVRGIYSLHLASSTPLGDIFKRQIFTVTGTGIGTLVTVVAYFNITSISGHALDRRGLYVEARNGSGDFQTNNYSAIDEATPTGDWIRATTTIKVPPNTTWHLDVRLYSPPGSIRWDDSQAVAMQSISTASITGNTHTPVDISAIVELMLDFIQNPTFGKSDLNIGLDNPTVGTKAVKHIQWADHIGFWDQLSEWFPRFDVGLRDTDATTRELVLYPGNQGTDRRGDFTIKYSSDPAASGKNAVSYTLTEDGGGVITDDTEIEQDTGSGPDREEGHYADATLIGGLVLQAVNAAPPKAEPASLNPIARDAVDRARRPRLLITVTLKGNEIAPGTGQPWDELLGLGDICNYAIDDGWVNVNAYGRISQIVEHNLDGDRLLDVTIPLRIP